ncbi:hypothetical protein HPB50_012320 [Hyalomma asiaticum]|uniref:Uncharacterized protein n=1 Tax=Hyalomma asiaticum TaxID=266040 RepID=A0ACB7SH66_HYAAI|nr:hypothetical protein HPB50_012320 [Hyalomma asiaticum]
MRWKQQYLQPVVGHNPTSASHHSLKATASTTDESWSSSFLRSRPPLDTTLSPASECPHNRHERRTPAGGRRTIATWTILDSAGSPVGWASRLPWELQHRPAIGDPPAAAPEPFRGNLLTERCPSEPLATYTPEEARLLCPIVEYPKYTCANTRTGPFAKLASPLLRVLAGPASRQAAVALLRTLRPQLLRDQSTRNETPPLEETMHLLDLEMDT